MPATFGRLSTRAVATTLIAALSVFLITSVVGAGWRDYHHSLAKAEIRAAGAAKVLETEVRWLVGGTDALFREGSHLLDKPDAASFAALVNQLPKQASLSLFDAEGNLVLATSGQDTSGADGPLVIDPIDFAEMRQGTKARHIGHSREGPRELIILRAVRSTDDVFRGTIQARLPAERLLRLADDVDMGADAAISVLRDDGELLLRWPSQFAEDLPARIRRSPMFTRFAGESEAVYHTTSSVDGIKRIVAFRRLADLGLVVVVAPTMDHVLADLRTRLGRMAFLAGPITLLLVALMVLAERTMNKATIARAEAQSAIKAKLHFISGTYHDLGQILMALDLFIERLRPTASDDQLEAIQGADTAVRSIHDLLDTIMASSQLASGDVRVAISAVPVRDILDAIATEVEPRALQKGLRLAVRGADLLAWSDPHLLERIVRNLVVNAIKFTSMGGVLIACRRVGDQVSIEVWDTGAGIPEDEYQVIFEAFHRVGRPLPARGLGLGLSIVDRFAKMLGHSVSLTSRLDHGSVFKLRLPLA